MKRELTYADQAKRIQKKYKGRTDKLSMDSMHRELAALEQQQEAIRAQMNLIEPQQMAAWGGPGGYVNQPDNNLLAMGGMIKRADGSYSKRGLWDNIRANKGSGKKPTKQMLEQEKKIKAEYAMGGMMYANGGGIDNPGFKALPIEVQNNIKNNMAMGGKYVTAGNEYHKVYRNADGDIMVNHPKEDKGKWDTINLTEKANANTIAEGVAATKKWHKENPIKKYAVGGNTDTENPVESEPLTKFIRETLPLPLNASQLVASMITKDSKFGLNEVGESEKTALYNSLEKARKRTGQNKGGTEYVDYGKEYDTDLQHLNASILNMLAGSALSSDFNAATTFGRVSYEYDPKTETYKVYDNYDFSKTPNKETNYSKFRNAVGEAAEKRNLDNKEKKSNYIGSISKQEYQNKIPNSALFDFSYKNVKKTLNPVNKAIDTGYKNLKEGYNYLNKVEKDIEKKGYNYYKKAKNTGYNYLNKAKNFLGFENGGMIYAMGGKTDKLSFKEINDNPIVQTAKIFDPTGISSYPDVYYAGKDFYNNPSWSEAANVGINVLGALPMIGKLAMPAKLTRAAAKITNKATGISKGVNSVIDTAPELIPFLRRPTEIVQDFTSKKFVQPFADAIKGSGKQYKAEKIKSINNNVDRINLTNNLADLYSAGKSYIDNKKVNKKAMGGEIESAIAPAFFSHGGGIHIDPSKKGTFTAAATKHGKSVQGFASQVLANKENYSPAMVKKANFAKNASKWKHADGGPIYKEYKMPDSTQVNSIHNRFLSNTQTGNNAKTIENWDTSSRLINSYNDGTPNDTSYIYMSPNETFFTSTKLDNGKPMVNHKVSGKDYNFNMPQDSINIYKNKINKNLGFAYGGPIGMYFDGTGKGYNGVIPSEETINKWNLMYPKTFDEGTEDGLKYLTPQPTPEFEMPYDQMVKTFGVPPSQEDYPVTAKVPFKPGYSEQKPKQKQPFNYLGLTQLAGPLMDLYYGIKGPDQVNFDRVRAEQINLAPQTQADLVRRAYSTPMYLAKQQGLGQGNYLNTLAAISGKAGENIGKSYLESKLAQEQFNAQAKTGANATNAQIAMQNSIARQQEEDAARSAVTKGAGELGKGIATLSIDPRLESAQSKQNKILKAIIVSQFPNMNLESLLT